LYGQPGTGKTLLAKAVANQTSATFLRVVGSELIQKYLGDGPKMVRELFRVAEEHAPVSFSYLLFSQRHYLFIIVYCVY
jgi:26S proteasome regulatory subunit T2